VGFGYSKAPDLILVDFITREVFDSGLLTADVVNGSVNSIDIKETPYGLSLNRTEIVSINNDNGYAINTIEANSGVATCYLETPILGFLEDPFRVGDKIFVEGITQYDSGTGYNSSDNGYHFFTVSGFTNSIPAVLEFNVSEFSTNPGIAKTIQNSLSSVIHYNDYPKFTVEKTLTNFTVGEELLVLVNNQYVQTDLKVTKSTNDSIKISGDYELVGNEKIKGQKSGVIATIQNLEKNRGSFEVKSSIEKDLGWKDDIGKLNDDKQVISDNDYYQNLSYSVNSSIQYEDLSTPVNRLLHTSGMKNFADTQIQNITGSGIKTAVDGSFEILDFVRENRVDEIKNFDYVYDTDASTKTKFIK
ncbi:hypothetical protein EB169_12920, partial [archaeon]|nr:hypothetical protein [archaeon]